jgi:hypothetical protein
MAGEAVERRGGGRAAFAARRDNSLVSLDSRAAPPSGGGLRDTAASRRKGAEEITEKKFSLAGYKPRLTASKTAQPDGTLRRDGFSESWRSQRLRPEGKVRVDFWLNRIGEPGYLIAPKVVESGLPSCPRAPTQQASRIDRSATPPVDSRRLRRPPAFSRSSGKPSHRYLRFRP